MIDKNVVTFVPLLHFHWCSHLQTLTEWWADFSKLTPMMNVVTPSMILFFQGSFKTKLAWACIFLLIFQCWADVPASGRPACPSRGFPGQRACTHSRCSVGRRPGGEFQVITHFYWCFLYCIKLDRIQLHNKTCRKSCQKSRQKSKEAHRRKWTRHVRRSFLLALSCCNYRMYAGNELKMSCKCFHKDLSFPLFESSFYF